MSEDRVKRAIKKLLGANAAFDNPLAPLTTWKVGGPAWCVANVKNRIQAGALVSLLKEFEIDYMPMGMGSNVLFSDQGYHGVVIMLGGDLENISLQDNIMRAGGGAKLSRMMNLAAANGFSGLEWAAGIPASAGGAVHMNAGARDSAMSAYLEDLDLLDHQGKFKFLGPDELPLAGYRDGGLYAKDIVLNLSLRLDKSSAEIVKRKIENTLLHRQNKLPLDLPNAGSVFKNPPGNYAGKLIRSAGLSGERRGDAQISDKHANFIVNLGRAKADDILELIKIAQREVLARCNIKLELEVEIIWYAGT
jgi:UDP-N-acetylmuramate dehydrogenase